MKAVKDGRFTCLPEVRKRCPLFGTSDCHVRFGSERPGCLETNRAVLREQARKEAAGYGVKDTDHPGAL